MLCGRRAGYYNRKSEFRISATARDRDLVRESVLRGLGWEILRLWSTDYWIDPAGVILNLDKQLKQLLESRRSKRGNASQQPAGTDVSDSETEDNSLLLDKGLADKGPKS